MTVIRNTRQILVFRFLVVLLIFITFELAGADPGFKIPPYVQSVGTRSATILWDPVGEVTGQVRYGTTTAYGASAEGRIEYITTNGRPRPEKASIVRAQLVALLFDTIYHYRVVHTAFESDDRTFRTAPLGVNTTFTFLVYGDSRSDPQAHARVIHAAAVCDPAFVLHTGDVMPFPDDGQEVWRSQFFEPADPLLRTTCIFFTRGNHDEDSPLFSLYFGVPGGTQVKDYYSFNWGAVHVTTIDTNQDYQPGSEQYRFIEQDLARTSGLFKIFFGHHPPYSSGLHGSQLEIQKYLQPLFEKSGVKLIFTGHNHDYERTIVHGITYVVTGGGGAPLHGHKNSKNPISLVFKEAYNFVEVNVMPGVMTLTAWAVGSDGVATIVDRAVITP